MLIGSDDPIVIETATLKRDYDYSIYYSKKSNLTREVALERVFAEREKRIASMKKRNLSDEEIKSILKTAADNRAEAFALYNIPPEELY